jgi:hypothetical protein
MTLGLEITILNSGVAGFFSVVSCFGHLRGAMIALHVVLCQKGNILFSLPQAHDIFAIRNNPLRSIFIQRRVDSTNGPVPIGSRVDAADTFSQGELLRVKRPPV